MENDRGRFDMARALLARARKHASWIGDDHGDRIEAVMLSGMVDIEMQVVAKEILDHLRAALDYCALEVWSVLSARPARARVYFPIAREGFDPIGFPALMDRKMPGVSVSSPRALRLFLSLQAFSCHQNAWLPDLATLSNSTKHDRLTVASVPRSRIVVRQDADGIQRWAFGVGHGPKRGSPWMALEPTRDGDGPVAAYEARYLALTEVNVVAIDFFREAIGGVRSIVDGCEALVE